ncbi:hypothetical protein MRX96_018668 [Rhipicephalus microplus]
MQHGHKEGSGGARAALAFHSSIAGVALVAVLLCLIVVACSLRDFGAHECKPDLAPIIVSPEKSHCYM